VRVRRVDEDGIRLWCLGDQPLDVVLDDQRVWSFWTRRDTHGVGAARSVEWPRPLARFLDGTTRLSIRTHVSDAVLYDAEMRFGDSDERIEVVNAAGAVLGIDKSGRMTATFEGRSRADMTPLLEAMTTVLTGLEEAGAEPFIAYGTLLGAVREGDFLGHDSDADLGYVSREANPVDVIRESFRLQRALRRQGHRTYRYSGAAFRVDVMEDDGVRRGLDVFGGWFDQDRLYLMGEIGTEFRREWIHPRTTVRLAGREFPAPAVPEELLRVTYGDSWRVPDPAFHFETPSHTVDQLTGWFRGGSADRREWQRTFSRQRGRPLPKGASELARLLHREVPAGTRVLDVGTGRGRDALWLARRGRPVTAYDFVPGVIDELREVAQDRSLPLDARPLNLTELRSVLGEGARLAHDPEPRVMLAHHVADATNGYGRESLARLASMALRGGGRLYLDVHTNPGEAYPRLRPVALKEMVRRLERHGARTLRAELVADRDDGSGDERSHTGAEPEVGRVVAQWD
jgi:SAM-dependent methyltransferase